MIDHIYEMGRASASVLFCFTLLMPLAAVDSSGEIELNDAAIWVDSSEPSYVQYAAQDLARYLTQVGGKKVNVASARDASAGSRVTIAIGGKVAAAAGAELPPAESLGMEGSAIRSTTQGNKTSVVIAGRDPHGTNMGVSTFLRLIQSRGSTVFVQGPLDAISKPDTPVRGFHMNGGWQLNHPYGFRTWTEEDWKRFVDVVWAQRGNLVFLWPYVETMTLPLSRQDDSYLQEFHRVAEYAQKQRGMEVWIMQSANRVALTDCGEPDPRLRPHWIDGCQKDMNPADPAQFANITRSFESLYRVVNNVDAFCLIDSDPGGWPQSPISDQVKIFQAARELLNRYNVHGKNAKLVDWMWIGWGRHKYFSSTDHLVTSFDWGEKNPDESDVAFMAETIRAFRHDLSEPWEIVAGMAPYLKAAAKESILEKTMFLPYGAIEMEPAFPATNMGFEPLREVLKERQQYPQLRGWMGNNELMLLQFPRSFYFMSSLWDAEYGTRSEAEILGELSRLLYPDHSAALSAAFFALQEKDAHKISTALTGLSTIVEDKELRPGVMGRFAFGPARELVTDLQMQLEIRLARQNLIHSLHGEMAAKQCAKLVEEYFDKILAWNSKTGWNKTINIGIWTTPLYDAGPDLVEVLPRMKQIVGEGAPYTSYKQLETFFSRISEDLAKKYEYESMMLGCVEPLKLAVAQMQ